MRKNDYKAIVDKLLELKKEHPTYNFGRHISLAFAEYGDIWGLSDKEALFALEKYEVEINMDSDKIASTEYMDKLFKDVEDFDNILNEEDDDT